MGALYKRGNIYWIKYYRNGKFFRESSGTDKKMVAKKLLDRREGEIANGKLPGVHFDKVIFDQLADDFLRDYKINNRKSLRRAERSVTNLKVGFEGVRATQITTPKVNKYIEQRLEEGAKNATINRELSALKRMLNMGAKQTPPLVDRVPYIPMLKENNARKGFFEHDDFLAMRDALPEYLKGVITFGYKSGWRVSEIGGLTWAQVDRKQGVVRLEVGETKNDDARSVYMDEELKEVFEKQWQKRKDAKKMLPYVFLNNRGSDRIKRFDKAWNKALKNAGIGNKYFHDLRRTAVRNMVRSGIPETVAMVISGHKTREVFDRYNITNDADLIEASLKQEAYLKKQEEISRGHNLGTIVDFHKKRS